MSDKIIYRQVGDYLIPNLELAAEEKEIHISVWGCGSPVNVIKLRITHSAKKG